MNNSADYNPAAIATRYVPDDPKPFRILDAVVILILLLLAFLFVRMFYLNLFQTLDSNSEPIGFVTMRINNIQRRQGDRVLWDRIRNESPVYSSDLIRVAEQSGVSFHFDNNSVELDENTMIRVYKSADGHTRIDLAQGTLNLDTGENGGNISIAVGGKIIEAQTGTVLQQVSANNENLLTVTEGFAVLIDETGSAYEAPAGTVVSFDDGNSGDINVDSSNVVVAVVEEEPEEEEPEEAEEEEVVLSLLPAPVLLQPVSGYTLGPSQLRTVSNITFSWLPVEDANAYLFTMYRQTANGRQLVVRTSPLARTNWMLSDFSILNSGRFIWQAEAVNRDEDGTIQRRGYLAERYFTVDIPVPSVELHETRNLYDQ